MSSIRIAGEAIWSCGAKGLTKLVLGFVFSQTPTWIWSTAMSMSSRMRTWLLRRGRQGEADETTEVEEEGEQQLEPYMYLEFGGKLEMRIYNIEFDWMFLIPAVCPGGSEEESVDVDFVCYKLVNGKWELKTKGERNREGTKQKWKFFIEMHAEDAKDAWNRRKKILQRTTAL